MWWLRSSFHYWASILLELIGEPPAIIFLTNVHHHQHQPTELIATATIHTPHERPMDEEETELRNPFPSPPSHYTNYTAHNLALLALLKQRHPPPSEADGAEAGLATADQQTLLSDQPHVPDWPLASLEPPRVDWVLAEGHYAVFGDTWFVSVFAPARADRYMRMRMCLLTACRSRRRSRASRSSGGSSCTRPILVQVRHPIRPTTRQR